MGPKGRVSLFLSYALFLTLILPSSLDAYELVCQPEGASNPCAYVLLVVQLLNMHIPRISLPLRGHRVCFDCLGLWRLRLSGKRLAPTFSQSSARFLPTLDMITTFRILTKYFTHFIHV